MENRNLRVCKAQETHSVRTLRPECWLTSPPGIAGRVGMCDAVLPFGPSGDGGPLTWWRSTLRRTIRFDIRFTEDERAAIDAAVAEFGGTPTTFIRRAINAALTRQPLLSRVELEQIAQAHEAFRRAGVNLNGLLHAVHRFDSGVLDQLPAAEEFRFMLDDIRTSAARYSDALKKLP
jgi:hypothetical protein